MQGNPKANGLALAIPAYNAAWCLPRLLESARAQAIVFDELLIYDDHSSDNTIEVATTLGAKVLRGTANIGCSAAKNRLLQVTRCEWIHFHDADDELLPNFTTLAHRWIGRSSAPDVVLFDYEYRDSETNELLGRTVFKNECLTTDPVQYAIIQQINPFCGLYRVSRLREVGGYDLEPEILYNEDVAFHCKLALAGLSFRAENELSIINYRVRGSMSGANGIKCLAAHHAVMRRMIHAVGWKYPEEIAIRLWYIATGYAFRRRWKEVDEVLNEAWKVFPGVPNGQSKTFANLCGVLGPKRAFRVREQLIRLLRRRTSGV